MRVVACLFGIVLLAGSACQKKVPAGFVERRADFKSFKFYPNLEGNIKLNVPVKFDTLLNWVDRSDAGGSTKLRFTSSKGCLTQESGYIHVDICDDDIDRLTIESYPIGPATRINNDTAGFAYAAMRLQQAARSYVNKFAWHSKSVKTINERQFRVLEYWGSQNLGRNKQGEFVKGPFERLVATTRLNQGGREWGITMLFECKRCDYAGFAKNAHTALESVIIDTIASRISK
ncbi:hypothetical protein [Hymenobacter negativus]|uniref:Lipoprotein n=1 Tax=Hymenobacter negativus TaxID=2795026 RepID=A0ABS3Q9B2_9BACT|nr:hypothetical protein [Hymenobacter negativus]MBO2007829.1 hypothetical protein [Hymenobacter negativus]